MMNNPDTKTPLNKIEDWLLWINEAGNVVAITAWIVLGALIGGAYISLVVGSLPEMYRILFGGAS
jgi:LytS/YehU family sensor histidine kinase